MAESKSTRTAKAVEEPEEKVDAVQEQKAVAAEEGKEYTPRVGTQVKVTGLVNTMYLQAGEVVHVTATDQLLDQAARGMIRIERHG